MKKNKGSLTVEACLSITIFLMVFLTIMYFVRIVFAYGIVQHSLNQVAKEFSSYTYYYQVSGLGDINDAIQNSTSAGSENFNENVGNLMNVYKEFGNLGDGIGKVKDSVSGGNLENVANSLSSFSGNVDDFKSAIGPAKGTIQSVVEDPMTAIKSVGGVLLNSGNEIGKTLVCGEISRHLMAKYISNGGYEAANKRLENLRIKGGLDGLNFSASSFWKSGNDIEFVVCYTINPIFPIKVVDELNFVNKVTVRGWGSNSLFE